MKYTVTELRAKTSSLPAVRTATAGGRVKTVLVSGGNGWLGRHVVDSCLQTELEVVVPVRATDETQAWTRVPKEWATKNVVIVPISSLREVQRFPRVDSVVHCATDMSLAKTLPQLWESNVESTHALFSWAQRNNSRFDLVSTLSVFVASDAQGVVYEEQDLHSAQCLYGGYAASKWCAEAFLQPYLSVCEAAIHRLGLLSYSTQRGWAPMDGVCAWGQAWQKWGRPDWLAPNSTDSVDWTPTTHASQGIVQALNGGHTGVFHWANSQPTPAVVWADIFQSLHGNTRGQWPRNELGKRATRALGRWSDPQRHAKWWWHDVFQSTGHSYDTRRSQQVRSGVHWTVEELTHAAKRIPCA